MDLHGTTVELTDSAGLEELTDTSPRALAQTSVYRALERTDVVLLCVDRSTTDFPEWLQLLKARFKQLNCSYLIVGTKSDLANSERPLVFCPDIEVSVHNSASIVQLSEQIPLLLRDHQRDLHSSAMHHTMVRCKAGIDLAISALDRAIEHNQNQIGEELVAAELRFTIDDLGSVIGEVHTEDILGEIFSRFCIGK